MKFFKSINLETFKKHRKIIEAFVADMTDDEFIGVCQVVDKIEDLLAKEMLRRNISEELLGADRYVQ